MAPTTEQIAMLRDVAGETSVVVPGDRYIAVLDPTRLDGSLYGMNSRLDASTTGAADEFGTLMFKRNANTYHSNVEQIHDYRKKNPRFERLLFQHPKRFAITPGKVVLQRPAKLESDSDYEEMATRVSPPFEWFNQHVNAGLNGKAGGIMEVLSWVLDHLLEGGMVGYSVGMSTIVLNGLRWRVPTTLRTYSGRHLSVDVGKSTFSNEQWYLKVSTGSDHRNEISFDTDQFSDRNIWMPMIDQPEQGVYRGVFKLDHPEGGPDKYPTCPYESLVESLKLADMLLGDDIDTMRYNQRHLILWKIDFGACRELNIPWNDTNNPDGTTTKGVISYLNEARQSANQQPKGHREVALPSFITFEEHGPGLELLSKVEKYVRVDRLVDLLAGQVFDDKGEFIDRESGEQKDADIFFYRTHALERFVQKIYDIIRLENESWFPRLNQYHNPLFEYRTKKARSRRNSPVGTSIEARDRWIGRQVDLRLDCDIEALSVYFQLIPSPARRDERLKSLMTGAMRGLISVESMHEAAGMDPDLERARKTRQMIDDRVPVDETENVDLWSAPPSYVQRSDGAAGSQTTRQTPSQGRPPKPDPVEQ